MMSTDEEKHEPSLNGDANQRSGLEHAMLNPNIQRSGWQRMRDWLWGYDFFVSYHWASGGVYAVNLPDNKDVMRRMAEE